MRIQITIQKEIADSDEGERLYTLVKTELAAVPDLRFSASMNQQITEPPEVPA